MKNKTTEHDFLFSHNAAFIEEMYAIYLHDASLLSQEWQDYFVSLPQPDDNSKISLAVNTQVIGQADIDAPTPPQKKQTNSAELAQSQLALLLEHYKHHGHKLVKLDPLGIEQLPTASDLGLTLTDHGINEQDLEINLTCDQFAIKEGKLGDLIQQIHQVYTSKIGIEFAHIHSHIEKEWVANRFEQLLLSNPIAKSEQLQLLNTLAEIETFEQYLHTKFTGAKRFSIEGGEATLAAIDYAIEKVAKNDKVNDIVIGMAHRGRLSTLAKIIGKPYHKIIAEFMGTASFPTELDIAGDVKYHMGYSNDRILECGSKIHISLAPNPSHLEAVNPVIAGQLRAKQDNFKSKHSALGILVHGDAAFCGQGVVAESFAMDELPAYTTSGIIHFVINNQIGFTADSHETRSGRYPTEFSKIGNCPILHVNGEDPEAVALATLFALDYRHRFDKACVINVVCYRKYGHNEGDEPMYTQAMMYNIIKQKKTPGAIYANNLVAQNTIPSDKFAELKNIAKDKLNTEYELAKKYNAKPEAFQGNWSGMKIPSDKEMMLEPKTGIAQKELIELGKKIYSEPTNIQINSKLKKLFSHRLTDLEKGEELEWAIGEALAFATMLNEGTNIRISGQDAERGTFSHRHSVLYDQTTPTSYTPLNNLSDKQGHYDVANSFLSEYAVLGFEYGYASVSPKNFVIWEAQFGDFANGAQIMFDQFISSAETKWLRLNGIVMLLPHGYEGQGPEHSSARLERFLQLAAENNMQIVNPSTPASLFHVLRRQMHRDFRKPLVVMTPKSLLRHKLAVSSIKDIDAGTTFKPVLGEIDKLDSKKVKKLVLCCGKVYYELLEKRRETNNQDTAIIRIEQLYPFPQEALANIAKQYSNATSVVWCQEEPQNMGSWHFILPHLQETLGKTVKYAGRKAAASPAVGYAKKHLTEQKTLVELAFSI